MQRPSTFRCHVRPSRLSSSSSLVPKSMTVKLLQGADKVPLAVFSHPLARWKAGNAHHYCSCKS